MLKIVFTLPFLALGLAGCETTNANNPVQCKIDWNNGTSTLYKDGTGFWVGATGGSGTNQWKNTPQGVVINWQSGNASGSQIFAGRKC